MATDTQDYSLLLLLFCLLFLFGYGFLLLLSFFFASPYIRASVFFFWHQHHKDRSVVCVCVCGRFLFSWFVWTLRRIAYPCNLCVACEHHSGDSRRITNKIGNNKKLKLKLRLKLYILSGMLKNQYHIGRATTMKSSLKTYLLHITSISAVKIITTFQHKTK